LSIKVPLVFSQDNYYPLMSPLPIHVGFVGLSKTGWASSALAPAMFMLKDKYTLVAVSTSSPESASASAEKYTKDLGYLVKSYHGDTSRVAGDPGVGLVAVAVRAVNHRAAVLPAIEAGKDIFIEWPAGANLKETTEIEEAARRKGIRTMVGLQSRHSPVITKVSLACLVLVSPL
jgi:predicted dehydrogenase